MKWLICKPRREIFQNELKKKMSNGWQWKAGSSHTKLNFILLVSQLRLYYIRTIKPAKCWNVETAAPVTNFIIFGNNKYTFASLTNKYNGTNRKHKDIYISAEALARTLHRNRQRDRKKKQLKKKHLFTVVRKANVFSSCIWCNIQTNTQFGDIFGWQRKKMRLFVCNNNMHWTKIEHKNTPCHV